MNGINWKRLFVVGLIIVVIMFGVNMLLGMVTSMLGIWGQLLLFIATIPILGYVAIWAVNKFKK